MAVAQHELVSPWSPPVEESPTPESLPLIECLIEPDSEHTYEYALQNRIAHEWRPLLDSEKNPVSRLIAYRKRFEVFVSTMNELSTEQKDGEMSSDLKVIVVRQASYVKNSAIDLATSLGIDLQRIAEDKLCEKMQKKYPPNAVTELRMKGYSTLDAMAYLKGLYENGETYVMQGLAVSEDENIKRLPKKEPYSDALQDVTDSWQRRSFGSDLKASDRYPNAIGEMQELLDEFEEMSPQQIIYLNRSSGAEKLLSIGSEIADVIIGIDGYTAAIDSDQGVEANIALNRMLFKYHELPVLAENGVPNQEGFDYLGEGWDMVEAGSPPPEPPMPNLPIVFAGSALHRLGYASSMQH